MVSANPHAAGQDIIHECACPRDLPESEASLRMHDRQKISNVKIAIKFGFFVSSQRACLRPVGQFLHASAINLPESDG
jgi:hypothetical protein